eukprot:9197176-Alexandrium_andersonii.AAC.1
MRGLCPPTVRCKDSLDPCCAFMGAVRHPTHREGIGATSAKEGQNEVGGGDGKQGVALAVLYATRMSHFMETNGFAQTLRWNAGRSAWARAWQAAAK